jgi:hypothetical protein
MATFSLFASYLRKPFMICRSKFITRGGGPGSNHFIGCDPKDLTLTKVRYIRVSIYTLI